MLVKEAHALVMSKLKDMKAIRCNEYATLYVFQIVHKNYKVGSDASKLLDSLVSVNKKTREVRDFKPFHIPLDEYKKGREILNFK